MAILRSKEIWEMEIEDIEEKLVELKAELAKNVSKSAAAGVNENPGKIRELKRTIVSINKNRASSCSQLHSKNRKSNSFEKVYFCFGVKALVNDKFN